jgi:hypothetical protein
MGAFQVLAFKEPGSGFQKFGSFAAGVYQKYPSFALRAYLQYTYGREGVWLRQEYTRNLTLETKSEMQPI